MSAESPRYTYENTFFELGDPARYFALAFKELYTLAHAEYAQLHGHAGADQMLGNSLQTFRETRQNPNLLPGTPGFNANMSFYDSTMVVARHNSGAYLSPVLGYGLAANNVSGTPKEQAWKRHNPFDASRRYANIREIVTHPEAPPETGLMIGALLMRRFKGKQPVSLYTWEDHTREMELGRQFGLTPSTDPDTGYVTWSGNVKEALTTIREIPGIAKKLDNAHNQMIYFNSNFSTAF